MKLLISLITLLFVQNALAEQIYTFCYGNSLGKEWNENYEAMITELLNRSDVRHDIRPAPTKRSEFMINEDECDIYTAISNDYHVNKDKYIALPERLFTIELNLYTYKNSEAKYSNNSKLITEKILQLDKKHFSTGYFRTKFLDDHFKQHNKSKAISLNRIGQGVYLLKNKRIDYFLTPVTNHIKTTHFPINSHQIVLLDTLFQGEISLYIDKSLSQVIPKVEENLIQMKKEDQWKIIFH